MTRAVWVAAGISLIVAMDGCAKKSGEAVIVSKEHIEKRAPSTPAETASTPVVEEERPMADDEIDVDGHVMKRDVRGTAKDPRALDSEQWLVKVRMADSGREFNVPAEQMQWDKLKTGDRVKVKYWQGKYTGTVWAVEIEDDR